MSNYNQTNIVDEIKSRCNIVDVIGRSVPLKRAGSNYKGVCPFHNEKTPSFVVSEQKQIFTCFGCGATGDVIEFVKRFNNLDFMGAAQSLADEYGINLEGTFKSNKDKDELYEINRQAARFWYKKMREKMNPGYEYMHGRGISNEILNSFGIGYAEDSWQDLYNHLSSMGFDDNKLLELGLVARSQKTGRIYDKFRNRVIFPIMNTSGKVIGFSGRIIGEGEPKYLNSQESSIFLKKNNLYGLNLAGSAIRKENRIILVEGQMDVVSLYQAGVRNVSASLGTALTENQARLIKRYTRNVILSYDADSAGQKAADRGIDILYREGLIAKVMKVSDGKDPDEFIKAHGRGAFMELADNAAAYGDFKINMIASKFNLSDPQHRVEFIDECGRMLSGMKPVEADIYIKKLSKDYNISESAIRNEYRSVTKESLPLRSRRETDNVVRDISPTEAELLKLAMVHEKYLRELISKKEIASSSAQAIINGIVETVDKGNNIWPVDENKVIENLDEDLVHVFGEICARVVAEGSEDKTFGECMASIQREKLTKEEKLLIDRLSLADEEENQEDIIRLTQELIDIQHRIKQL